MLHLDRSVEQEFPHNLTSCALYKIKTCQLILIVKPDSPLISIRLHSCGQCVKNSGRTSSFPLMGPAPASLGEQLLNSSLVVLTVGTRTDSFQPLDSQSKTYVFGWTKCKKIYRFHQSEPFECTFIFLSYV